MNDLVFEFDEWSEVGSGQTRDILMNGIPIAKVMLGNMKSDEGQEIRAIGLLIPVSRDAMGQGGWRLHGGFQEISPDLPPASEQEAAMHHALSKLPGWVSEELTKTVRAVYRYPAE